LIGIAVVIPTYRSPEQLAEAIASVLRQSGVTLEILVTDDCPDGSARDVAGAAFRDARLRYLRNPRPNQA
jgi:glycosyltransferase involved in cell wall biosynthesis